MLIIPSILLSNCLYGLIILLLLLSNICLASPFLLIFSYFRLLSILFWLSLLTSTSIFLNKISDFFIGFIANGLFNSFKSILKLNVFAILSHVSGINGDKMIVASFI